MLRTRSAPFSASASALPHSAMTRAAPSSVARPSEIAFAAARMASRAYPTLDIT